MSRNPCDCVNTFLGTAGDHGQMYPGAERPFGLVKVAPDTYPGAVRGTAHSGYDYDDRRVLGFSHLRVSGTGCEGVGGNVLLLPCTAPRSGPPEGYAAPFDKQSEQCCPGYYAVRFESGVCAELTATDHVGVHRYTFPEGSRPHLLLDLGRGFNPVFDVHAVVRTNAEMLGEFTSRLMLDYSWYRMFFCIQFQLGAEKVYFEPAGRLGCVGGGTGDRHLQAVARFSQDDGPLMVKVGLSSISASQARRNIQHEAPDWDFDGVREACAASWRSILERIDVAGEDAHVTQFYTHLYRTCLSPFNILESRGTYMGEDGEEHIAAGYTHYNGWSLWDSYRTKFSIFSFLTPTRLRDMMHSLALLIEQRKGLLPKTDAPCLHGYSAAPNTRFELASTILLEAFAKGISPVDVDVTYAALCHLADTAFLPEQERLGYVPRRPDLTCEYAYDNWAAAQMAEALGREEDRKRFAERAGFYRNVWDKALRFYRARDEEGNWLEFPDDPTAVGEKYVYEGSAWHWRWATVHDIAGVVELMGGRDAFIRELDYFYQNDLHNHGNQPSIHAPWLFAAAGAPWLTQKWVRLVLDGTLTHRYGTHGFLPEPYVGPAFRNAPDGMIPEMDDDDGCMSGWYALSSMGLFPVCVGRPLYGVGTPLFGDVVIHGENGKDFRIVARNQSHENHFIQSARLDGAEFARPWLAHREIVEGGTL
ncbi:MAG TPA: glycoside hydrolase family 92 protein, partial [Candidatus Hydrogenedentes bacterium]|nr:glycoside hydrolase family 92 protein [Candidatus Hydrogenedentota bacterium]